MTHNSTKRYSVQYSVSQTLKSVSALTACYYVRTTDCSHYSAPNSSSFSQEGEQQCWTPSLAAEDAGTQSTLRATAYSLGSIDLLARTAEHSHAYMHDDNVDFVENRYNGNPFPFPLFNSHSHAFIPIPMGIPWDPWDPSQSHSHAHL